MPIASTRAFTSAAKPILPEASAVTNQKNRAALIKKVFVLLICYIAVLTHTFKHSMPCARLIKIFAAQIALSHYQRTDRGQKSLLIRQILYLDRFVRIRSIGLPTLD